jgi:Ca2+-binding RTX toxin-like protein
MATLNGDSRNNRLNGTAFADLINGFDGDDLLLGQGGNDTLLGGNGNDRLIGGLGADIMRGGTGNDIYVVDNVGDRAIELGGQGIDTVQASISWTLSANLENLTLTGTASINGTGNELNNTILGNTGSNVLSGLAGNDVLWASAGNDVLLGGDGNDNLDGGDGNDNLDGGIGADFMGGGLGNDTYTMDNPGDFVLEAFNQGTDTLNSSVSVTLFNNIENLNLTGFANINGIGNALDNTIVGNSGNNFLSTGGGNDRLFGGAGDDALVGGAGNDALDGGTGNDNMVGGAGDDTYTVDSTGDQVTESANSGLDWVFSNVTFRLGAHVDALVLTGTGNLNGTGNELNNAILGNSGINTLTGDLGDDYLDGGIGADQLIGGAGNDTYVIDNLGDRIIENINEGTETVISSLTIYTLGANLENLTLAGSTNINGTGNELNNIITGNTGANNLSGADGNDTLVGGAGDDTLNGGGGTDTMIGGIGNDIYVVVDAGDTITEEATGGTDTVFSSVSYTLAANVENLTLTFSDTTAIGNTQNNLLVGSDGNNTLFGGLGNDTLSGGAGNDLLDGGAGSDRMAGGIGNDTFVVDDPADFITELANEGTDQVNAGTNFDLSINGVNVENLTLTGTGSFIAIGNTLANSLTGNSGNNSLDGGAGDDYIDGGAGEDTMIGGLGNDTFILDNVGDGVVETVGAGTDTAIISLASGTGTFSLGNNVENIVINGTANINVNTNDVANTITGNDGINIINALGGNDIINAGGGADVINAGTGNDTIDGGAGDDRMSGGAGDDTYTVDSSNDLVIENLNEGTDLVLASTSFTLSPDVENLTLTGTGNISGVGNTLANLIIGNAGNNALIGGLGNDTLRGGLGNDTYSIDSTQDVIDEAVDGGIDQVNSTAASYTLGANLENLTLEGTGNINGTGNAGDNLIVGNSGNNTLIGGLGNDTLEGGAGNDRLEGGAGTDTLVGGDGNDTFVLTDTIDTVTEGAAGGTDTIEVNIDFDLGLPAYTNIENLTLTGSAVTGSGNASANVITGNSGSNVLQGGVGNDTLDGGAGNDRLDGGIGADTLVGGEGNDTYIVDDSGDVVSETVGVGGPASGGIDTVESGVNFDLSTPARANIENLTLTGASVSGIGNALNNTILGNANDNILRGGAGSDRLEGDAGNDLLDGGTGIDTLIGGAGNDTYVVDSAADVVTEASPTGGTDTVEASVDYSLAAVSNVENLTLTGTAVQGTGNDQANSILGNASDNILLGGDGNDSLNGQAGADRLVGGIGADTMIGGDGNDTFIVDDAGDVVTETSPTGGVDLVESSVDFDFSVPARANLEHLTLTGTATFGTGNDLNNTILGNASDNTLSGGAGNDRLEGFAGKDRLVGGTGNDTMIGGADDDTYEVDSLTDVVTEVAGSGTDTVESSISLTLAANVENLTLTGTAANGTGNELDNTILGNASDNILRGELGNDTLDGGAGNDQLDGGAGTDTMIGGDGNDLYGVDSAGDIITEAATPGSGIDTVRSSVSFNLQTNGANVENLILTGTALEGTGNDLNNTITGNAANNVLLGGAGDDQLIGDAGSDRLDGGTGNDLMDGGTGNDTYIVDAVGDTVVESTAGVTGGIDLVESAVNFDLTGLVNIENLTLRGTAVTGTGNALANIIIGNAENNVLIGNDGNDTLQGEEGGDRLIGGAGADTLSGGAGNDTYIIADPTDVINETGDSGDIDTVESSINFDFSLPANANLEILILQGAALRGTGNALNNSIVGNAGNNILAGGAGDDILLGDAGDDRLDGGIGNDTMNGGTGNDTYVVDNSGDVVQEDASGGGIDTVESTATSITLGDFLENLVLLGSDSINGAGNALNNSLTGNSGNNQLEGRVGDDTLNGGAGDDRMLGGLGNDTYFVDSAADEVLEDVGEGTDVVNTSVSYTLSTNSEIEELILQSGTTNLNGIGNRFANRIVGNDGNNLLDGGAGADLLIGGLGNDTYGVDDANDVLQETSAAGGIDTVRSAINFDLSTSNGTNIENLTLLEDSTATNALGNALRNTIVGNSRNNLIDGQAGDDTMIGGLGNDTYVVDNSSDVVTEEGDQGIDTVLASIDYTLGNNLENLTLNPGALTGNGNGLDNSIIGNAAANTLGGGAGNDYLDGGAGADNLNGGTGDDTYVVDNASDVVSESPTQGTDLVIASISYTLTANVENLTLSPTAPDLNINATGNSLNNTLIGNAGNNLLDGLTGADRMEGGLGNDSYLVDQVGDEVVEVVNAGIDLVTSNITYTLGVNLENLILAGVTGNENLNGTGNIADNSISGNAGDNVLLGLEGNDILSGGAGNDRLDGGTGADAMTGGAGNDTYIVQNALDTVTEGAGGGTDLIESTVDFNLATSGANVENLTLTGTATIGIGNDLDNTITGNERNNQLDGGGGIDRLEGGAGNDTYEVNLTGDVIVELADGGIDTVNASATYTLSDNLENLNLTGTANINGFGNGQGNEILGNSGNNVLNGRGGGDRMTGGLGDDTYHVDNVDDFIVEATNINEGIDTVISTISFTLNTPQRGFLENLTLDGTDAINGIGNQNDNILLGNLRDNELDGGAGNDTLEGKEGNDTLLGRDGNDILRGEAGNDILRGGAGIDTLTGGLGSDSFVFDTLLATAGIDVIQDFVAGEDALVLDRAVFQAITQGATLLAAEFGTVTNDGAVTGSSARIVYNTANGNLFYNVSGTATQFATLSTRPGLTEASFVIGQI